MNQRDIQTKIDTLMDNLDKLNILKAKTFEEFISDFRNIDSALHSRRLVRFLFWTGLNSQIANSVC